MVVIGGGSIGASTLYHLAERGINAGMWAYNGITDDAQPATHIAYFEPGPSNHQQDCPRARCRSSTTTRTMNSMPHMMCLSQSHSLVIHRPVMVEKDQLTAGTTWHSAGLLWRLRPADTDIELIDHTRHLARNVLEQETGLSPGWIENGGLFIASNERRLDEYKRLQTLGMWRNASDHHVEARWRAKGPRDETELGTLLHECDMMVTQLDKKRAAAATGAARRS